MSLLYTLLKDLKEHLSWADEDKLIDNTYFEESGIAQQLKEQGIVVRWTHPEKVEQRKLKGYDIVYQLDGDQRVRHRLIQRDGVVLMGKTRE